MPPAHIVDGRTGSHAMNYCDPRPIGHARLRARLSMSEIRRFSSPEQLKASLGTQQYIANDEIATIMYLSQELGKPLLTEGPAGVGKTELAKAIAGATGRELIRLQCYEGLDET